MTWTLLLLIAAGTYAQKAVGPLLLGGWTPPPRTRVALHLLAVPVLAGLVVVQTVGASAAPGISIDARLPALVVAAVAVWRGAPFVVVVGLAALVAAGIRLVT